MRGAMETPTVLGWSPLLSLTQPSSEAGRLLLTPSLCPLNLRKQGWEGARSRSSSGGRELCVCVCVCMCVHVCV